MLELLIDLLIAMIGVWLVEQKMVLPSRRIDATFHVLLFSSISFFVSLISVPYNALIIAHEQMKAFAYIGIVDVVLKLLVAYLLIVAACNKLMLYAVCMMLVTPLCEACMLSIASGILLNAALCASRQVVACLYVRLFGLGILG